MNSTAAGKVIPLTNVGPSFVEPSDGSAPYLTPWFRLCAALKTGLIGAMPGPPVHRTWKITSGCCFKLLIVWSFVCSNRRRMHVSWMYKCISKFWQPPLKYIQNLMPSLPSYLLPLKLELPAFIVWIITTDCWLVCLLLLSHSNCFFVLICFSANNSQGYPSKTLIMLDPSPVQILQIMAILLALPSSSPHPSRLYTIWPPATTLTLSPLAFLLLLSITLHWAPFPNHIKVACIGPNCGSLWMWFRK